MLNISLLKQIFPKSHGTIEKLPKEHSLPAWVLAAANIHKFNISPDEAMYLIEPKKELTFDALLNIQKQVAKRLERVALLIVDEVNPKYRGLFVNHSVPFIFKDVSIYAPELGIKLMNFDKVRPSAVVKVPANKINSFELKIVAGYLTGFLTCNYLNLDNLLLSLMDNDYKCSKSKLSQAINHFLDLGYMQSCGSGPNRKVKFNPKQYIWEELQNVGMKSSIKRYELHSDVVGEIILSGESALAEYSDLSEPAVQQIAMTNVDWRKIAKPKIASAQGDNKVIVEVFKESPRLFSIQQRYLNPVELYFSLKNHTDERIQLCLDQMLNKFNINK